MILQNRLWLGAAAGAAYQGIFGDKNTDFGQRMTEGVVAGAMVGAITNPKYVYDSVKAVGGLAGKAAGAAASSYGRGMWRNFDSLATAGVPMWKAGLHSFGRLPVLMGAGAAIGAMVDSDDRKRGAMIGAGAGVAARLAITGPAVWKKFSKNPMRKMGAIAGLSALAFAGGSYLASKTQAQAEAVRAIDGGYEEQAPGTYKAGLKERLESIGAHGHMVFGAHNKRHGR